MISNTKAIQGCDRAGKKEASNSARHIRTSVIRQQQAAAAAAAAEALTRTEDVGWEGVP
jgi:hypothetical protein